MDYRDELRLRMQQALLQERHSLPQPRTITPIFWDKTPAPGQALNCALCCFLFTPTSHVVWTGQPELDPENETGG